MTQTHCTGECYVFGGPKRGHGARSEGRQQHTAATALTCFDTSVDDTGFLEDGLTPSLYKDEDIYNLPPTMLMQTD